MKYSDAMPPRTPKVRRRTALPQELLYGDSSSSNDEMARSYQPEKENHHRSFIPLARVPSAPGSLK